MPKIRCPRGHIINLSNIPVPHTIYYWNEHEWDETVDEVVQVLQAPPPVPDMTMHERVNDALAGVTWRGQVCLECGALTLPEDDRVRWFLNVPVGVDYSDTAGDPP